MSYEETKYTGKTYPNTMDELDKCLTLRERLSGCKFKEDENKTCSDSFLKCVYNEKSSFRRGVFDDYANCCRKKFIWCDNRRVNHG